MTLRWQLRRLEDGLRGTLESFVLEDGSRHYYDPQCGKRFLHCMDCLRAQGDGRPFPEPPETIKALARARERASAVERVLGTYDDVFPYDKNTLIERGELVPRSLVAGRELGEHIEHLSE